METNTQNEMHRYVFVFFLYLLGVYVPYIPNLDMMFLMDLFMVDSIILYSVCEI